MTPVAFAPTPRAAVGSLSGSAYPVVTAGGSAHTKGSWVELLASAAFDVTALIFNPMHLDSSTVNLWDLGIGAAGDEQVIVSNLMTQTRVATGVLSVPLLLPIGSPAGARLAGRYQSSTASAADRCGVYVFGPSALFPVPLASMVDTYGVNTGTSRGTSIDPGGTAETKNAWTGIVAATTRDLIALVVAFGGQNNATRLVMNWLVDVGIGAAGDEQVIVPDLPIRVSTQDDTLKPAFYGPLPVAIPAGVRLAVRAQCSGTDATDRLFDVALYGLVAG